MTEYLTTTTSLCSHCARLIPARVEIRNNAVYFHKICPDHGAQDVRVFSDAGAYLHLSRFYRPGAVPFDFAASADKTCPDSCGLCPDHEQHVCMPIIDITDHCDLNCPVCLVRNRAGFHLTRPDVARILDSLIRSERQIDVLNLSGGEPTLNPHFRDIVNECLSRPEIIRTSVSTNGLRLLDDPSLLDFLAERRVVISLQFDGLHDDAYLKLRGRPLLADKMRLIDHASRLDAPMSLTVTLARGANDLGAHEVLPLLFARDNILSVMFQPLAYVGSAASIPRPADALTIPDVLRILDRSDLVSASDFLPLPCSHPACFTLAFYLRVEGDRFLPMRTLVDVDRYMDVVQNRSIFGVDPDSYDSLRSAVTDLWSGPSALTPDSRKALAAAKRLLASVESCPACDVPSRVATVERSMKSIFIHHFMDRHNFDLARARKCCNVYPLPDGRLIPACVRNCLRR